MTTGGANSGDIFDVKKIRRLVELMKEHDLAEIDLRQADQRIRLRRGGEPQFISGGTYLSPTGGGHSTGTPPTPPNVDETSLEVVKRPMVDTLYAVGNPESPP